MLPAANSYGAAAGALGLGDNLAQQVAGETDEERKKRMAQQQQMQQMGPSGSLAVNSIFGPGAGVAGT